MGFEDEVKQSFPRPCRQTNGGSKLTCELTSSIVPRGTSFHRSVELEFPSTDKIVLAMTRSNPRFNLIRIKLAAAPKTPVAGRDPMPRSGLRERP